MSTQASAYRVGDIIEVELPSGRMLCGWLLYISHYFKDLAGAVFPINGNAFDVQYTNIIAAQHYGWRVVGFREPRDVDIKLTERIVGGAVFIGDQHIRSATTEDYQKLPEMLVKGMPVVFDTLEAYLDSSAPLNVGLCDKPSS